MMVKTFAALVLAVLGVYLAGAESLVSRSLLSKNNAGSNSCHFVERASSWYYAFADSKFEQLAGMYHRTAIRYDNGVLSPVSDGLPFSPDQLQCIAKRVNIRPLLRNVAADEEHGFVGVHYDWNVKDKVSLPIYASLQYDRQTCLISTERYYFPTEHPGWVEFLESVADDCFPPPPASQISNIDSYKRCFNFFRNGEPKKFVDCFAPRAVYRVNGVPVQAEVLTVPFWANVFNRVKFSPVIISSSRNDASNIASFLNNISYSDKKMPNGPHYSLLVSHVARFNEAGKIIELEEVFSTREGEPLDRLLGITLVSVDPSAETLGFSSRIAGNNYIDTRVRLLAPTAVSTGSVLWRSAKLKSQMCLDEVYLMDTEIIHNPRINTTDQPRHVDYLTGSVIVKLSSAAAILVRRISPTIAYSPVTKHLSCREYNLGSVIACLRNALRVAVGETPIVEGIRDYGKDTAAVTKFDSHANPVNNRDGTVVYNEATLKKYRMKVCSLVNRLNSRK